MKERIPAACSLRLFNIDVNVYLLFMTNKNLPHGRCEMVDVDNLHGWKWFVGGCDLFLLTLCFTVGLDVLNIQVQCLTLDGTRGVSCRGLIITRHLC